MRTATIGVALLLLCGSAAQAQVGRSEKSQRLEAQRQQRMSTPYTRQMLGVDSPRSRAPSRLPAPPVTNVARHYDYYRGPGGEIRRSDEIKGNPYLQGYRFLGSFGTDRRR